MQDTELFLSLAEIAGVFVGFGALIAVRSGGASEAWGIASIGMVVMGAAQVIVLALAPVAIGRFAIPDHVVWVSCSVLFLVVFWVLGEMLERLFPERMAMRTAWPMKARWRVEVVGLIVVLPMHLALIAILLGVAPDADAALYFGALVLLLLMDVAMLLYVVVSGGRSPSPAWQGPDVQ
jgi:hypothetical protein